MAPDALGQPRAAMAPDTGGVATAGHGPGEQVERVVGRIGRPHGVRGEVSVDVRTDSPDLRFAIGSSLRTEPPAAGPVVVAGSRWHSGRLLLEFRGVTDRDAAEAFRGLLLLVDVPADESPADVDEFFDHQLIGLDVRDASGLVGVVGEVLHLPAQDVLMVATPDGYEVLVPFVAALVPKVDLASRTISISPPPGLFPQPPEALDGPGHAGS
jgi:16S rRNA processing protein RimM